MEGRGRENELISHPNRAGEIDMTSGGEVQYALFACAQGLKDSCVLVKVGVERGHADGGFVKVHGGFKVYGRGRIAGGL